MTFLLLILCMLALPVCSQVHREGNGILTGAEQTGEYMPLLKGKRVAVMANQTSMVGPRHLVDTLRAGGVELVKVFSTEHGFRGDEADGILMGDGQDPESGLPVISLYGKNRKPSPEQLRDVDLVIFDIQDVGVRFYTFISSMHYLMEACAENGKELLVLDRPNPNGNYTDGPVLEKGFESFIGLHPVPVVHGMTVAEYARMINGEGWLKNGVKCKLQWVPCKNYRHSDNYSPPVPPSPNLPNIQSIKLYPSLAFFEGTMVSEGRGTLFPFQVFGYPGFPGGDFEFTPVTVEGKAVNPKYEGMVCQGFDLRNYVPEGGTWDSIRLDWLTETYKSSANKTEFFKTYFEKLAGTDQLRKDIQDGLSIREIRAKWEPGLETYRKMREKYMLYEK